LSSMRTCRQAGRHAGAGGSSERRTVSRQGRQRRRRLPVQHASGAPCCGRQRGWAGPEAACCAYTRPRRLHAAATQRCRGSRQGPAAHPSHVHERRQLGHVQEGGLRAVSSGPLRQQQREGQARSGGRRLLGSAHTAGPAAMTPRPSWRGRPAKQRSWPEPAVACRPKVGERTGGRLPPSLPQRCAPKPSAPKQQQQAPPPFPQPPLPSPPPRSPRATCMSSSMKYTPGSTVMTWPVASLTGTGPSALTSCTSRPRKWPRPWGMNTCAARGRQGAGGRRRIRQGVGGQRARLRADGLGRSTQPLQPATSTGPG
jgi:hypothetical protein